MPLLPAAAAMPATPVMWAELNSPGWLRAALKLGIRSGWVTSKPNDSTMPMTTPLPV